MRNMDGFTIEKLGKTEGRQFISDHHYSGGCSNAAMIWGLFDSGELVGAIAFATPVSENVRKSVFGGISCECNHIEVDHMMKEHVTELHRLFTFDHLPHNTNSWFISRALDRLKDYKPKYWTVVSFADSTEGHIGTVYKACSFTYYGTSDKSTFYRDESGRLRHPRQCGENITVAEAQSRGWEKESRGSKHRYYTLLPDNQMSRHKLKERVVLEEQDYPDPGDWDVKGVKPSSEPHVTTPTMNECVDDWFSDTEQVNNEA